MAGSLLIQVLYLIYPFKLQIVYQIGLQFGFYALGMTNLGIKDRKIDHFYGRHCLCNKAAKQLTQHQSDHNGNPCKLQGFKPIFSSFGTLYFGGRQIAAQPHTQSNSDDPEYDIYGRSDTAGYASQKVDAKYAYQRLWYLAFKLFHSFHRRTNIQIIYRYRW